MGPVSEFSVLGPLVVRTPDRGVVPIRSPLQRALLVRLLIEPGRVVSVDRLVEDLWGDEPPEHPANALRYHVWQLRDALDPDRRARSEGRHLRTKPPGYLFDPADSWIDVVEFDRLRAEGRALVEADPARAASLLRDALDLWRADALADVADREFASDEARRLEECRLLALEDRIAADLACGLADELVPELEELVARHPWRERVRGQLMVALFRSGRQADALAAYREARELLGRELGIEPSPELRAIEEQVVLQDAALGPPRDTSAPTNLPAPLSSFVGRDAEIDELQELLERHRFITVVGPPGVGKTRLAMETARARLDRHPGGAWLVDLAPGDAGTDVADTIADVLGLGRADRPARPQLRGERPSAITSVLELLRTRQALLVLDNCERLLDDVARTAGRILASCPSVTVLATSRRTIGLGGERILELQPLAVADDRAVAQDGWSALLASPAGKLFVDRSEAAGTRWRRSRDDAAAIATLCRRLDGLPLALELAAARTRSMALTDMIDHLTERFRLVSSLGADSRTASLHEALQSSRELLTETEARTFDALSVFAGAFDLAAADAVVRHVVPGDETAFELLGQLVDHSLLTVTPAPRRRFRMLESVREFANEHLRSTGGLDAVVSAHTAYYSKLVEEAWARRRTLDGDVDLRARLEDSQQEILTVIERMRAGGDRCGAQRVAGAMGPYWSMKWFPERGLHACDAIGDACPNQDPAILARFLWTWSAMHALMGNADTSAVLAERTHRAALEAGDWALAADALIVAPEWPFFPSFQTDPESWSPVFALYRRADDALGEAWAYDCRGWSAAWSGRYLDARQDFRRAAELFESVDDQHGIASARLGLTASCRLLGDLDAARRQLERASESACRTSSTHVLAEIEWEDAELARAEGDADRAVEGYARALALLEERSPGTVATNALRTMLGWVLRESGRRRDALEVMLDALRFCVRSDVESRWKHGTFVLESLAGLCAEAFDACIAATLYGAAHAARLEAAHPMPEWDVARFERDVALLRRRLVSDEFDRCWRAGSELTPEAAARAAISDLTPILADGGPVTTS